MKLQQTKEVCKLVGMKKIFFLSLLISSCSYESNNEIGQVLARDGVLYSEKTNKPINGTYTYQSDKGGNYSSSYKNGIKHGVQKIYDEDMRLIIRQNYQDGILNGLYESFDPNGQMIFSGSYQDGKEIGLWRFFEKTGKLLATGNSLWDARDNHFKNLEKLRLEKIKKRDRPSEVFLCFGTQWVDRYEPKNPKTYYLNEEAGLVIDYRNQTIKFKNISRKISEGTKEYIAAEHDNYDNFSLSLKDLKLRYGISDISKPTDLLGIGLIVYPVVEDYYYECEKN